MLLLLLLLLVNVLRLLALLAVALRDDLSEEGLRILRLHLHNGAHVVVAPVGDLHECFNILEDALFALLVQVLREVLLQIVKLLVVLELVAELAMLAILGANFDPVHLVEAGNVLLRLRPFLIDAVKDSL